MVALTGHASDVPSLAAICLIVASAILEVSAVPIRVPAKDAVSSKSPAQYSPLLPLPAQAVKKNIGNVKKGGTTKTHATNHKTQGTFSRRSSMFFQNDQASFYVISNTRDYNNHNQQGLTVRSDDTFRRCLSRRQTPTVSTNGVPGTVDIMTYSSNSTWNTGGRKLASLRIASNETTTNSSFILNASNSDQPTTFTLYKNDDNTVRMVTPVYDESAGIVKDFCASYDPAPPAPQPMRIQTCQSGTWNESSSPNLSQKFRYNVETGRIDPIWVAGQSDGTGTDTQSSQNATDSSGDNSQAGDAGSNSSQGNNTELTTRQVQSVEEVALFFAPSVPTYYESLDGSNSESGNYSGSLSAEVVSTTTSLVSSTGSITVNSIATTDAPSTTSTSDVAGALATSAGVLNVEVVGPSVTSTDLETTSSTVTNTSTPPALSTSTSANLDAEQVAASIAGEATTTSSSEEASMMTSMPT